MKVINIDDCDNNIKTILKIVKEIEKNYHEQIDWEVLEWRSIPINDNEYTVTGELFGSVKMVYEFEQEVTKNFRFNVSHKKFLEVLLNTKTVYLGEIVAVKGNIRNTIRIFDGDIIEIEGEIEDKMQI